MDTPLSPDISLQVVRLPVPILRHSEWLDISFPHSDEKQAIEILKENLPKAQDLAASTEIPQLKIAAPIEWSSLKELGFSPTVYRMTTPTDKLPLTSEISPDIQKSDTPEALGDLIESQFRYHSEADPLYYTTNPKASAREFMEVASEAISLGNGFLLAVSVDGSPIGFLYGDHTPQGGTIDELFIVESFRNKGYGTALLSASRYNFAEAGCTTIEAYVSSKTPAVLFYDSRGFSKESVNWIINLD
jgi:GNAT superfamily N-acetyltransferase